MQRIGKGRRQEEQGTGERRGAADGKRDVPSPQAVLMRMSRGYQEAKTLQVIAELGIADLIAQEPKTAEDLSKILGVDSDALYRLLRALASLGIFKEISDSHFENTPLSEAIRADVPGSVRDLVIMRGGMDRRVLAVLLHEQVGGAVDVEVEDHSCCTSHSSKSSHVTGRRAILSTRVLAASFPHCHGLPSRRHSCRLSGASIPWKRMRWPWISIRLQLS